ncbi:MAG: hypothetical protein A2600_00875 [Candidatus Lambdaproteobacteria bacterium RIFOXYD1_FULL_56_27]|uniref:Hcy-binding domain-containing protein n=1 Tax=Candidatus Lambdaproteobacteria bacterium RIFOXYD2_FULL_56_26 TaxID=1817773 RepID=A0A1F6GQ87_9PROT|nr:MAG: hypothetical protein A2557_09645 [Candidatus Lambdaproteobacteria bacterium RIFOXYD2_FULL_56_26]OGH01295.1 MAG: hypothetical protein A2426_12825 [Candidatus Lambdaproteobacteria bacterium RIFOXYC1_FULL_56_13]OGH06835.1 MAG: hypothetical protein A2600_00875 [Candidatus Lambdaproteobacteria bacterium RIFOXYD1_FULL_56_27]
MPQFLLEEEIPLLHLYHQAMKSGAQLVRCPTGKTSFSWLEPLGLAEKIEAVHNVAVQSAKHTQAQGNFDLLVAGVIGPRPQTAPYANERALEREVSEPAIYLIDKGVDCLLTQGFEDLNTLEIALRAIKDVNRVPVPVSVFFRPGPELQGVLTRLFALGEVMGFEAVGLELPLSQVARIRKSDLATDLAFGLQILPEPTGAVLDEPRALEALWQLEPTLLLGGEGLGPQAWEELKQKLGA